MRFHSNGILKKIINQGLSMKKLFSFLALAAATISLANSVEAATITTDNSGPYLETGMMAEWDTVGNDMSGMMITAYFSNGTSNSATWGLGAGAVGNGWSLTLDSYTKSTYTDTIATGALWNLDVTNSNLALDKIVINGAPGNTVFDRINYPIITPGSAFGWPIDWTRWSGSATNTDFTATYSTPVKLGSLPAPLFDIYSTLTIDFDNSHYFSSSDVFKFYADTDNIVNSPVPEPISLFLFGTGLIGLAGTRMRRKK
jgi:hypothetical protein